jgi:hypothetical protein
MADQATVQSLGERYALCLAEERDLARRPGQPLGSFLGTACRVPQEVGVPEADRGPITCEEWIKTQGSDPDERLSSKHIRALVPSVFEVAQKTWALLDRCFPREDRGPTVFQ